jgi:murein DD-endopeptidase MepM/ murein hydrolase activator NlpD
MDYFVNEQVRRSGTIRLEWIFGKYRLTQGFGLTDFAKKHLHDVYIGLDGHEGTDWGFPPITPVRAAHGGEVVRDVDENETAYGIYVCIWDPKQEIATYYCHLSRNTVKKGQHVDPLTIIGFSGNTAGRASKSTGPHLHFGLCRTQDGFRIDKENGYKGFIDPLGKNVYYIGRPERG